MMSIDLSKILNTLDSYKQLKLPKFIKNAIIRLKLKTEKDIFMQKIKSRQEYTPEDIMGFAKFVSMAKTLDYFNEYEEKVKVNVYSSPSKAFPIVSEINILKKPEYKDNINSLVFSSHIVDDSIKYIIINIEMEKDENENGIVKENVKNDSITVDCIQKYIVNARDEKRNFMIMQLYTVFYYTCISATEVIFQNIERNYVGEKK